MTPELAEKVRKRLKEKSVVSGDCILWTGGINGSGYGVISICNRSVSVHKAAHEVYVGPIPENGWIGHRCGVRHCINPEHLFLRASGVEERFWEKVIVVKDSCWKWTGDKSEFGYGRIQSDKGKDGVLHAHRVSWEIHFDPIPDGLLVCHKCDNPECTNPDHLFLGTDADNMADKTSKGRQNRGETHPSAILSEKDVLSIIEDNKRGVRNCEIASRLCISQQSVCDILKGRHWKHLTQTETICELAAKAGVPLRVSVSSVEESELW